MSFEWDPTKQLESTIGGLESKVEEWRLCAEALAEIVEECGPAGHHDVESALTEFRRLVAKHDQEKGGAKSE